MDVIKPSFWCPLRSPQRPDGPTPFVPDIGSQGKGKAPDRLHLVEGFRSSESRPSKVAPELERTLGLTGASGASFLWWKGVGHKPPFRATD